LVPKSAKTSQGERKVEESRGRNQTKGNDPHQEKTRIGKGFRGGGEKTRAATNEKSRTKKNSANAVPRLENEGCCWAEGGKKKGQAPKKKNNKPFGYRCQQKNRERRKKGRVGGKRLKGGSAVKKREKRCP